MNRFKNCALLILVSVLFQMLLLVSDAEARTRFPTDEGVQWIGDWHFAGGLQEIRQVGDGFVGLEADAISFWTFERMGTHTSTTGFRACMTIISML